MELWVVILAWTAVVVLLWWARFGPKIPSRHLPPQGGSSTAPPKGFDLGNTVRVPPETIILDAAENKRRQEFNKLMGENAKGMYPKLPPMPYPIEADQEGDCHKDAPTLKGWRTFDVFTER